ncbi:MAG TPA: plastocyanin/azurin family copper-binding protein [Frankiaceae bacterium]|nr:plastocyanin/azurin family copper-binding protein [Frankiaceae bacterium]
MLVALPAVAAIVTLPGAVATARPYAPAQAGETKVSTLPGNKFDPAEITVAAGSKVTWQNTDGGFHTVTGGEGPQQDPASPLNGQLSAMGATYSVTFDKPGTYPYFCQPHVSLGMKGKVIVTAGGPATTTASASAPPAASSAPPASASASATVGAPQQGAGAPTNAPAGEGEEEIPGVTGNKTLEMIEAAREEQKGAVSGFRFFAAVATAFLFILGAAVMFSTRPRRAGR